MSVYVLMKIIVVYNEVYLNIFMLLEKILARKIIFYELCLFRMYVIRMFHKFLSFMPLSNVRLFTIPPTPCSVINPYKLAK